MAAQIKILPKRQSDKTRQNFKLKINTSHIIGDITIAQQSFRPPKSTQYYFPVVDVSQRFEESLERCRKKRKNRCLNHRAIDNVPAPKQIEQPNNITIEEKIEKKCARPRYRSESVETYGVRNTRRASELVDQLLLEIYGRTEYICDQTGSIFETEYGSSTSIRSVSEKFDEKLQYSRLILKNDIELRVLIAALRERVTYSGSILVKQLKRRDALKSKQEKMCNVITAHLQACSRKRSEDTNMRFSPTPVPGDSGFNQWRDAMKMVAKLPGGIPPEFRRKLWLELSEKYLQSKGVNWNQTERFCFNEWSNPDDNELGVQIVKDLHRTGCSLFCGAAGQENQALLKRVLLAYARWNKSVGYCQGFNMLAALILQVMDKSEADSVKVMIYLIEGVLPESYFANNLRGLSVDMVVFRDLLKMRLPQLSKHLEALQNDAREGNSYEPPLTNVFTMQWFLTLFCNCLPQSTVLRVWDLIFLEGNEILLRTAIAIWEKLSDRILAVNSADEFYSIMGVLTREMLEFGLVDSNTLVKSIVAIGACSELNEMRDRYLYNITPWTQSVQTAAKKGLKLFYSDDDDVESDNDEKAAVTAAYGMTAGRKRERNMSATGANLIQPYAHGHPDRERLALDISALKKQYARLRERQRQAHIILQAACARQPIGPNPTPAPIAMNHLLLGKNAIVNSRGRRLGPPKGAIPPARKIEPVKKNPQGETVHWKDTAKIRYPRRPSYVEEPVDTKETFTPDSDSSSYSDDDGSSTSTELCDEPDRLDDFDSDDKCTDTSKTVDRKSRSTSRETKITRNRNKTILEKDDAIKDSDTNLAEVKTSAVVDSGVNLTKSEEIVNNCDKSGVINENILVKIDNQVIQTEEVLDVEANKILNNETSLQSQYSTVFSDNNEETNNQILHSQNQIQPDLTLNEETSKDSSRDPSQYDLKENQIIEETTNTFTLNKCEEISVSEDIKSISTNITLDNTKTAIEDSKDSSNKFEDPVSEFNTSESQNFFTFDNSSSQTNLTEESPVSSYNLKDNWSNIDDSSLIVEPSLRTLHFSDQASSFEDNPLSFEESQEKKYDQPNLLSFEDQIEGKQTTVSPGKSYSSELISNFEEEVIKQEENDRNEVIQVENKEEIQTELKSESSINEIDDSVNQTSKDKSSDFDSFMEERFANQTSEDISCDFDSFLEERVTNQKLEEKACDFDSFLEERVKILKQNTTPSPQEEVTFTWKLNDEKLRRHKSYEETLKTDINKSFIYKQKSFDINASPDTEPTQWEPFQFNTKEKKIVVEKNEIKNETKNNTSLILLSPERRIVETANLTTTQSTCNSSTYIKDDAKKGTNTVISPQSEDCLEFRSNIDKITNVTSDFKISSIVNTENKPLINSSEEIITCNIKLVQDTSKEENQKKKICAKDDLKSSSSQIEDTILEIPPLQPIHGAISKEEIKNVEENSKRVKITRSFENVETLVSEKEDIITEQELKEEICSITLTSESPNTTEGNQIHIDVRFFEDKPHATEIRKQSIVKQPSVELLTVEDKRLEAGRRNSERALKIIQENSVILHRILQHQRSSEVEDSEEELSKSPISKTFLRSESLLSKTDDDRSSKDEDDLSGTESYSVSPAILDEDLDKSPKRDTDQISPEKVTSLSEEIDLTLRKEAFSKSKYSSNNTDKVTSETFTTLSEELSNEIVLQIKNEAHLKSPRIEESIIKSPEIDINADRSPQKLISLNEEIANENDSKFKIEAYTTSSTVVEKETQFLKGNIHKAELPSKLNDFSEDLLTKQKIILGIEDYTKDSSIYKEDVKIDIHKAGSSETLTEAKEIDRINNESLSISIEEENKRDVSPKKITSLNKDEFKENNFQIRDDECLKTQSIEDNNKSSEKNIEETAIQFRNETFTKNAGPLVDNLDKTAKIEKYENVEQSKQNEYQVKENIKSEEETKPIIMNTENDFQIKSSKQDKNGDDNISTGKESQLQKYSTKKIEPIVKDNELVYFCRSKSPTIGKYEAKAILKDNEPQLEKITKPDESQLENVIKSEEIKTAPKDKEDEFVYRSKSPKTGKHPSEELRNITTYDENKSLSKDKKDEFLCRSKSPKHDKYDTEEIGKILKSTENYTASKGKEDEFLYKGQSLKTNKYASEELGKITTFEENKSFSKDKEDHFLCRSKSPKHDKDDIKESEKFTKSEDNTVSKDNEEYLLYKSPKKNKYDGEDILKEKKSHLQQITKPEEYKSVSINNDKAYRSKSPKPKIYDSGEKEAKNKYGDDDMLKEKESHLPKITKLDEHKSISKDKENEDFRYRNKSPKKDKCDIEENITKKKDGEHEYLYKRKYETLRNPFSPVDEPSKIATSMHVSPSKHSTKDRYLISPENEASQISPYSSPSKYSSSSKSSAEERRDSLSSYGRFQSFQEDEPVSSFQRSKEYKKRATSFDSNEFDMERYSPSKFRSKYTSLGSPVEESSNEEKYISLDGDRKSSNFKFLDDSLEFSKENIKHTQFESSGRSLNLSSKDVKEEERDTFRKYRSKSPEEGSSKEPFVSSKRHKQESSDFEFNAKYRSDTTSHEILNTSRYNSPGRSLESQKSPKHLINEDSEIFESPRRHLNDDKLREKSPTHLRREESLIYESPRRQFDDILKEDNQSDIQRKYSPKHLAKEELLIYESPRRHYENISKLDDKQKEDIPKYLTKDDTTKYESPRRQLDDIYKEDRSSENRFRTAKEDMCDKYKPSTLEDVSSSNETTTNYESPRRKYIEKYKDSSDRTEKQYSSSELEGSSKLVSTTKFESPRRKFDEFQDDKPSDYEESSKYVREVSSERKLVERSSKMETSKYESPRRKLEEIQDDKSSDRFAEFEESSKYVKDVSYSERQLVGSSTEDSSSKYLASTRLRNEEDIDNKPTSTVKNSSAPSYYNYADNSSDYHQFNKNNLSIDLASSRFTSAYSPEVSPPKHLSCLQFTTFQTDIPCTSKTLQISPICSKEKSSTSPTKPDPKFLPSFSLPTLSPPRRTVKSPLSPDKTFNPFPVQPTTRQPKDVGIRLGLYKDASPLKSPAK